MAYLLTFLLNAVLAFGLSLAMAGLLGPDAYGRFAIGLSIAIVVSTLFFDWLRLATMRFQGQGLRAENPNIRRTLDLTYLIVAAALCLVVPLALPFAPAGMNWPVLLAAFLLGIFYGFCEYRIALARVLFREGSFVALTCLRGLFGLVLASTAAFATGDPALALAATALASALPVLLIRRALRDPSEAGAVFDRRLIGTFIRYGAPLVAANALYQLMPLLNRVLLAGQQGFVEAGYFSLVSEIAMRLLQNIGVALDLLLFQIAVREDEMRGREAADFQISRNAAMVAAIIVPSAAGLCGIWPAFEAIFIPQSFRGHLGGIVPLLLPALAIYALILFAVNPFFQMRHRTLPVVASALVALMANLIIVLVWRPAGASGYALAQLSATILALVVTVAMAIAKGARLPWRDFVLTAVAACGMLTAILPLRDAAGPVATLVLQIICGGAVYAALALLFDLCGSRAMLRRLTGRPTSPPRASIR